MTRGSLSRWQVPFPMTSWERADDGGGYRQAAHRRDCQRSSSASHCPGHRSAARTLTACRCSVAHDPAGGFLAPRHPYCANHQGRLGAASAERVTFGPGADRHTQAPSACQSGVGLASLRDSASLRRQWHERADSSPRVSSIRTGRHRPRWLARRSPAMSRLKRSDLEGSPRRRCWARVTDYGGQTPTKAQPLHRNYRTRPER